ncbi:TIGR03826 family flagellar region protein [Anoxynatronum sibiricum]|uniref:TIGR03826 family flagellar region protein n=1 Tax=Anoxynatronum sibiricum TaxID=210623 RepID=A0ABU9VVC1_9CLOT
MSNSLINCTKCGRAFMEDGNPLCRRCRTDADDDYKVVKEYVYDNPGATILEVHEATGVNEKQILIYLREGRLEIVDENNFVLDCQRCSVPIRSGKYCEQCAHEMATELRSAITPKKKEPEAAKKTEKSQRMYVDVSRRRR